MAGTDLCNEAKNESFLKYRNEKQPTPIVVVVGDGRSRVRRVVRTTTRHVTVVSYSTRHRGTQTHTSHHVTTVSFPQKANERSNSSHYGVNASAGSLPNSSLPIEGGAYVYLQQNYTPSSISSNSSAVGYAVSPHSQMIYQHSPQQYPTCHQQLVLQAANNLSGTGKQFGQYLQHHQHHHRHLLHGQQCHPGGVMVTTGIVVGSVMGGGTTAPSAIQQHMQKKNSIRNCGDVLKRSRAQTAYELSQDLLEKQIELLERKYGGICARNAAITIQRAFRHYMMVKKFASITAMAKAEKRLSRRVLISSNEDDPTSNASLSSANSSATESQAVVSQPPQPVQQPRVTIMAGPPGGTAASSSAGTSVARTPPTRSLSVRERRQVDCSPISHGQIGVSAISANGPMVTSSALGSGSTHPHVNLLHAAEPRLYSGHHAPNSQLAQYCPSYQIGSQDLSFLSSSSCSHLDSSLNSMWVSSSASLSHTPYYSAAQIYMRPKGTTTSSDRKKVPPEVPKRTSSITAQQYAQQHQQLLLIRQSPSSSSVLRSNGLCKTAENGSLTSVQSSGSDSSITSTERIANSDLGSDRSNSPHTWKRIPTLSNSQQSASGSDLTCTHAQPTALTSVVSGVIAVPSDDQTASSHTSAAQYEHHEHQDHQLNSSTTMHNYKISEIIRKRQYRVGLNLFNKKPEKGISYLIRRGFLENSPQGVARFLISRKGLSRQMIGEYLGNLQNQFNMAVLNCFALELDLSGMQVDVALRKFQAYFRMPGEAQKIERLMEIFSQRFCQCNQDIVGRLRSSDTIFVLAFAIIMLNTDLHTPNLKPERRMRLEDFVKNLRGIDDCHDIDKDMLAGIYERVKANEFKPGSDHVTQVMKVQATIVGKKPNLALPHRRLVCYCRLYEIPDINKKERPGVHQREVFLFNDLLIITKIFSKKKSSVTYTFRNSFPLCGMVVSLLEVPNYPFCIQLSQKVDGKIMITFNARNEHDRCKFAEDLKESISEMDEMESLRIEAELDRQKSARNRAPGNSENRDSGVADVELCPCPFQPNSVGEPSQSSPADSSQQLKRSALSNSLLDIHEQFGNEKPQRRGSVGSLDSGMSVSFQSTTTSSVSRENAAVIAAAANAAAAKMRFTLPTSVTTATIGNAYSAQGVQGYSYPIIMQQQQQQPMQLLLGQPHGQCPQTTANVRSSGRDRIFSRSDESGRSTEV